MDKKELKEIIEEDKKIYFGKKNFKNFIRYFTYFRFARIGKYIILLRKLNYYQDKIEFGFINKLLCFYYKKKKNKLGEKLNLEIDAKKIGRRLIVFHGNVVINGYTVIGDDCKIHGNSCIGNKGINYDESDCPILGNNVIVGVGSNIIGKVKVGNNVCISANSLVNKDVDNNVVVGGIPAKILKKIRED